ncbi:tripartite tricarboxylate transporter TctB family protein [Paenibacillus hodogayensis]|uniref:Tripartite tricarboxylate transporter TctB family protein n=1 Tax=Paenibacillus hodogayensis TaxID=279208 RepID=A0ABV5VSP3_9BACL
MMSRTVHIARLLTALLFLAIGLITLWHSHELPFGSLRQLKPGFFPNVFGGLLTGLSVLMLIGLVRNRPHHTDGVGAQEADEPVHWKGLLSFIGIFVLFLAITYALGFVIAMFVALAASGFVLGLRGWRLAVLAIATTAAIWLIFDLWLGVSLPPGIWL